MKVGCEEVGCEKVGCEVRVWHGVGRSSASVRVGCREV